MAAIRVIAGLARVQNNKGRVYFLMRPDLFPPPNDKYVQSARPRRREKVFYCWMPSWQLLSFFDSGKIKLDFERRGEAEAALTFLSYRKKFSLRGQVVNFN